MVTIIWQYILLRDVLIEQLMREIVELKDRIRELEEQNEANQELIGSLRQQLEEVWNMFMMILTNLSLSPLERCWDCRLQAGSRTGL